MLHRQKHRHSFELLCTDLVKLLIRIQMQIMVDYWIETLMKGLHNEADSQEEYTSNVNQMIKIFRNCQNLNIPHQILLKTWWSITVEIHTQPWECPLSTPLLLVHTRKYVHILIWFNRQLCTCGCISAHSGLRPQIVVTVLPCVPKMTTAGWKTSFKHLPMKCPK